MPSGSSRITHCPTPDPGSFIFPPMKNKVWSLQSMALKENNVKGPTLNLSYVCVTVLLKTTNLLKQKFALENSALKSPWPCGHCRADRVQVDKWTQLLPESPRRVVTRKMYTPARTAPQLLVDSNLPFLKPTLCGTEIGQNGTLAVLAYAYYRQWECPPAESRPKSYTIETRKGPFASKNPTKPIPFKQNATRRWQWALPVQSTSPQIQSFRFIAIILPEL